MRKPTADHRSFRFPRPSGKRFSHLPLLCSWPVYLLAFFLTEKLVPVERCHVIHCALDDRIPFNEYFAVFYCLWYVLLAGSLLYFLLYDADSFRRLQAYLIITQIAGLAAYILYPSVQLLRPDPMPRDNLFCHIMSAIYAVDTPTGVCPSLHVAFSLGIASAWLRYKPTPRAWKTAVVCAAALISLSTVFVKQHSVLDIAAALPVCLAAECLVYGAAPALRAKRRPPAAKES